MCTIFKVSFRNSGIDLYYRNIDNVVKDIMGLKSIYYYDDAIVVTESILTQLINKDKFTIETGDKKQTISLVRIYLQD